MTNSFAALTYQSFPCNAADIPELRDLRLLILEELQRALYVDPGVAGDVTFEPTGIVCEYVEVPEIIAAWKLLLCGCLDQRMLSQFDPQIATWETVSLRRHSGGIRVIFCNSDGQAGAEVREFPLVWDKDTWAIQLVTQDWWPDLHLCVELHFSTNPGMRNYPAVREQPIAFECTRAFWRSVNRLCRQADRRRLIEALAKLVYGIHDASLGLEPIGETWRFRVTDFWRVHCRREADRFVLEEFGPHDISPRR